MIWRTALAFISIAMVPCMKVSGVMTNSMAKEKSHGLMDHHMKDNIFRDLKEATAFLYGRMAINMKENLRTIILRGMEFTNGLMVADLKGPG